MADTDNAGRMDWAQGAAEAKKGQSGINWQARIAKGMRVMTADGEEIGEVRELGTDDFLVDRSLQPDAHVPYLVVGNVKDNTVMLDATAGQVGNLEKPGTDQTDSVGPYPPIGAHPDD